MPVLSGTELAITTARVGAARCSLARMAFVPRNTTTSNPLSAGADDPVKRYYTWARTYLPGATANGGAQQGNITVLS